jgi:molybdopterin converting factor subunit 1
MKVLLFAGARDALGAESVEIETDLPISVAELKENLSLQFPRLAKWVAVSRLALNNSFATDNDLVERDSEVALIPPVSGG